MNILKSILSKSEQQIKEEQFLKSLKENLLDTGYKYRSHFCTGKHFVVAINDENYNDFEITLDSSIEYSKIMLQDIILIKENHRKKRNKNEKYNINISNFIFNYILL